MMNVFVSTALSGSLLLGNPATASSFIAQSAVLIPQNQIILASGSLDLANRHPDQIISEGFQENILIALGYLGNSIILEPSDVFAFHKNILPEFRVRKIVTQESGFGAKDGYKAVAGLYGNGVCHLASLMNMVAQNGGLEVMAEVNHNFAPIPGIDKKYGTSIYFLPRGGSVSERQNLYIVNNFDFPVELVFSLEGDLLKLTLIASY